MSKENAMCESELTNFFFVYGRLSSKLISEANLLILKKVSLALIGISNYFRLYTKP